MKHKQTKIKQVATEGGGPSAQQQSEPGRRSFPAQCRYGVEVVKKIPQRGELCWFLRKGLVSYRGGLKRKSSSRGRNRDPREDPVKSLAHRSAMPNLAASAVCARSGGDEEKAQRAFAKFLP
jgi:hypothetical protein